MDYRQQNIPRRKVLAGDCLDRMQELPSDCIDAIYLDPPFNSNRKYQAPVGTPSEGAEFSDRHEAWVQHKETEQWHGWIAEVDPDLYKYLILVGKMHSARMRDYLIYMAVRILEMKRVLKPTGNIMLHCDDTASSYLRTVMDALFGQRNFQNQIIWQRSKDRVPRTKFSRNADHILFYRASGKSPFNPIFIERDEKQESNFNKEDQYGRFTYEAITKEWGTGTGVYCGYDPEEYGRKWVGIPTRGYRAEFIKANIIPDYPEAYPTHMDKLAVLHKHGVVVMPGEDPSRKSPHPALKSYRDTTPGSVIRSVITHIPAVTNGKEYQNYPTQKPVALLEILLKAITEPGQRFMDPFAGCASSIVAAEKLGLSWLGIDLSELTDDLMRKRILDELGKKVSPSGETFQIQRRSVRVIGGSKPGKEHQWKQRQFGVQQGICRGCMRDYHFKDMTRDHIKPRKLGGTDEDENLQLLCASCNTKKSKRTMRELWDDLLADGIIVQRQWDTATGGQQA